MPNKKRMKNITICVPHLTVDVVKILEDHNYEANFSDFARRGIRKLLTKELNFLGHLNADKINKMLEGLETKIEDYDCIIKSGPKVCTINVPESFVNAMNKPTGAGNIYTSRSELIRSAVKEELKEVLANLYLFSEEKKTEEKIPEDIVRIPVENENGETVGYEDKHIIKKLE